MAATTIAEKIAEIERKQNFTSDWFEESLQEMADFVKAKCLPKPRTRRNTQKRIWK